MASSFRSVFVTVLLNSIKSSINRALVGAGLALFTTGAINVFVEYYKAKTIAQFGQLGSVTGLLHLSGLDKSISIIIGAYMAVAYFTLVSQAVRLGLPKK